MKMKSKKILSILLSIAVLFSVGCVLSFAVSGDEASAKIVSVQLSDAASGAVCSFSSHDVGAQWLVDLYFDQDIVPETSDISSYYQSHLTTSLAKSKSGTTTCGTELSSLLLIDGKTVSSGYIAPRTQYTALHVQLETGTEGSYLRLAIPQNNTYGLSASQDFTVTLSEGIKLNGFSVEPEVITVNMSSKKYTLKSEEPEEDKTAMITLENTKISSSESGICADHAVGAEWWIDIRFDQDIIPPTSDVSSYYQRHMTVDAASSQSGATTAGSALASKIFLNEKTIDACYGGNRGQYTALHVQLWKDSAGQYLRFAIPKDNSYGFNGDSDFTIILSDGIFFNGYHVKPTILNYNAFMQTFSTADYDVIDDDESGDGLGNDVAAPVRVKLRSTESGTCTEHNKGPEWVTDIYFDKNIVPPAEDVSTYYQKHLTVIPAASAAQKTTVGTELCGLLRLNGKPINKIYTSDRGQYNALHVQLLKGPEGKFLRIAVPKDNAYGFNPENGFTVTLKDGILLNGYAVSPSNVVYEPSTASFSIQPYIETSDGSYHVLGTDRDENGNSIKIWPTGTSKYVDFILSDYLVGTSKNSEAFANEHGEASRNCIYIDGLSVGEWMNYGAGNLYQVMVRFEDNYIRFLLDGSREPGMSQEEYHWVEFTEGLVGPAGETIVPCKLYYDPNTCGWTIVDSFDGLQKPWWITDFEKNTEFALAGLKSDSSYVRPAIEWEDSVVVEEQESAPDEGGAEFEVVTEPVFVDQGTSDGETVLPQVDDRTPTKSEKVGVKVKKKVKGDVIYEEYFPTWAIFLVIAGAVVVVGGGVFFILHKKHRKKTT